MADVGGPLPAGVLPKRDTQGNDPAAWLTRARARLYDDNHSRNGARCDQ